MRQGGVRRRLSLMMALIYAVQGAWWPMLAVHLADLHVSDRARGWIFSTTALASILTPLGAGQLADRKWATQRLLALIYGLGTFLLILFASGWVVTTGPLFLLSLVYWTLTAPALGLAASLALRNLERPSAEYGRVRLWGTVGWMVISWIVSGVIAVRGSGREGQGTFEAFWVAALLSATFALYALTLPNTPPLASGASRRLRDVKDALSMLRDRSVATYLVVAFGVCLTTPFVYQAVPRYLKASGMPTSGIALAMSLGQTLEIVSLSVLPLIWNRLGTRWTLALGIGAWVVYYSILSARLPLSASLLALPFNGVAIACFHVAGQMFLDDRAPADRRAGAQSLYIVVTSGAGTLLGSLLAGEVVGWVGGDYAIAFLVPCAIDALLLGVLLAAFRPATRVISRVEASRPVVVVPTRGAAPLAAARLSPDR